MGAVVYEELLQGRGIGYYAWSDGKNNEEMGVVGSSKIGKYRLFGKSFLLLLLLLLELKLLLT